VVVLGLNEPDNLRIMTTTFREGDPGYAGALAGVALGLDCFHILELRDEVPADVWQEQMALKELEIGDELAGRIVAAMREARGEPASRS
jgi:glycine reductase